jgi:phospholipid-translocating ATPase
MADGLYQSVITFFIPYLVVANTPTVAGNGKDVVERLRLGAYIAHPAVITINLYILINTYTWDWLTVLIICISDLLIFFWTGVYTAASSGFASTFYGTAAQIYSELSFWIVLIVTPLFCIAPRYASKAFQKVFWPYDVDIIREQVTSGKFGKGASGRDEDGQDDAKESLSASSGSSRRKHHRVHESVDEDLRPIYPPSVTAPSVAGHGPRSQRGSDGTNYTRHDLSMETPVKQPVDLPDAPVRPSMDRVRPSYDRLRQSMDRAGVRASFEASNDFTTAAMLSRFESTRSGPPPEPEGSGLVNRIRRRTRGKSFKSPFAFHKDSNHHIEEHE